MLDQKKRDEIELKVKKRTWIIYTFIKSEKIRNEIIAEMLWLPWSDDSFIHAEYYANIDLFRRYIEIQQKPEKRTLLEQELTSILESDKLTMVNLQLNKEIGMDAVVDPLISIEQKLKELEILLKKHHVLTVKERMEKMTDDDFFTPGEILKRKAKRLISKFFG